MIRTALLALTLAGSALPASADDAQDYQRSMQHRQDDKAPRPIDMSRSVTLTGYELQAYVTAAVAASRAQVAAEAAAAANEKIRAALTPPEPAPAPSPAKP